MMTKASDPLPVGGLIGGKYRVIRLLGRGGMGSVYEAENTLLRSPVAIKVLRPDASDEDDPSARFVQEAQAAAQVRHPNIVSVLDIGREQDGVIYIVQEFLTGQDLRAHLKQNGPLDPCSALEILMPVMRGLSAAHNRGIIHRDIKPDNIFLCETVDGVIPKVIDFGVAKVLGDDWGMDSTRSGLMVGTMYYMSPEQARGDRAIDARTDVWSLGAVLYQALTGRRPYEASTAPITLAKIITQAPTSIRKHAPDLPEDVVALVHKALEPERERRIPSMEVFFQMAAACSVFEGAPPRSSRSSFTSSVVPRVVAAPFEPSTTPTPPPASLIFSGEVEVSYALPPPPRRRAVYVVAAAVLTVLCVGAAWFVRARPPAPVTASLQAPPVTTLSADALEPVRHEDAPAQEVAADSSVSNTPPSRDESGATSHAVERRASPRFPRHGRASDRRYNPIY